MTTADDARPGGLGSPFSLGADLADRLRILRTRPQVSYLLVLGLTTALVAVGLVFVLSASSVHSIEDYGSATWFLTRQLMWAAGGFVVLLVTARFSMKVLRALSIPVLAISLLALMAVPVVGATRFGSKRWIDFGSIQLQPSEIAKIALILWCADILVRKQHRLHDLKHLLIPILPITGFFLLLILGQPDMGTAMVVAMIVGIILWVVGTPGRIYAWMLGIGALGAFVLARMQPYRWERMTSFVHPFKDASDTGYQAVQGFYALSSGGWFGVGLGGSREKWSGLLPNAHTDFIFAIIGEETGLIGTLLVLSLFVALALTGVRIARRTSDDYARLVAAGVTAWLVGQAILNVATVVGAAPITGIPLPFISYGGTSLVLTMAAAGMLAACARTEPGAQEALARRGRKRRAPQPPNVVSLQPRRTRARRGQR